MNDKAALSSNTSATTRTRTAIAEKVVRDLDARRYDAVAELFSEDLRRALPSTRLRDTWEAAYQQFGVFKGIKTVHTVPNIQYTQIIVSCEFTQLIMDISVVFDRKGAIAGLHMKPADIQYTPPQYVNKTKFDESTISILSDDGALPGTLTCPVGGGVHPVVVLIHGSGPLDRDASLGGTKLFRDLAWGLASQGIAVYRYDKRTHAHPEVFQRGHGYTVENEYINDAVAAVTLVSEHPRVCADHIYLLGHSMGGMMMPRIAVRDSRPRGYIIMAGNLSPLHVLMIEQYEYITRLDGGESEDEVQNREALKQYIQTIDSINEYTGDRDTLILGAPVSYWIDLHGYDPAGMAGKIKKPILVLHGGRDYQITDREFNLWKGALIHNKHAEFIRYPKLNHLFIEGSQRSEPSEYYVEGHVHQDVISDLARWIESCSTIHFTQDE